MKPVLPILATLVVLIALPAAAQTTAPAPPEPSTTDGKITGATDGVAKPFGNFTEFLRGGNSAPLVSRRDLDALERDKFGGSTIDPAGRNDDFFSAPEPVPSSRLKRY